MPSARSAVVLLLSLGVLAGCRESVPTRETAPRFNGGSISCDIAALKSSVRSYFAPAQRPSAMGAVEEMDRLLRLGDAAGATDKGFDLLALLAEVNDAGTALGTFADGSTVANGALACMQVGAVSLPMDFTSALSTGAFEVRGGGNDSPLPVLSRDGISGVGVVPEFTWTSVFGARVLLFGQPNANAVFQETLVGLPYDWTTIPAMPSVGRGAVIGFCILNTGKLRVEQDHGGVHSILFLRDPSFFLSCPNLVSAGATVPRTLLGRVLHAGLTLFRPNVAWAAAASDGPVGGSATGFSGFGSVDAGAVNLSFVRQAGAGIAGQRLPRVTILAAGNGGTPLPQVRVRVSLVTLQGSGSLTGGTYDVTGSEGLASFPRLTVTQPGTYQLRFTASLSGYPTVTITSSSFQVN